MNQIDSVWSSDDEEADDSYREWNASESLKGDGWSHGFTAHDWSHYMASTHAKLGLGSGREDGDDGENDEDSDGIKCPSGHGQCALLVHEPKLEVVRHFTLFNWHCMGDSLSCNPGLECVDLTNCKLRAEEITALFGFRPGRDYIACAVKKLTLAHNPLGPRGLEALLPFLRVKSQLAYLNLNSTKLGAEGTMLLSAALNHVTVEWLHVRGCGIDGEGVERILAAEKSAQMVELCILENEDFGPRGYAAICRFLERNDTALKKILTNCTAAEDAARILESLTNNITLQDMFLWGGTDRDNESIKEAAPSLRKLVCGGSSLESVVNSNYSMKWVGLNTENILAQHPIIRKGLDANARSLYGASQTKIVRNKLREFYFRGDYDLAPFAQMDTNLMPFLLELVTRTETCEGKGAGYLKFGSGTYRDARGVTVDGVFRIVRNCHMPALFSFRAQGPGPTRSDSSMDEVGSEDSPPSDTMECSSGQETEGSERNGREDGPRSENPTPSKRSKSERDVLDSI